LFREEKFEMDGLFCGDLYKLESVKHALPKNGVISGVCGAILDCNSRKAVFYWNGTLLGESTCHSNGPWAPCIVSELGVNIFEARLKKAEWMYIYEGHAIVEREVESSELTSRSRDHSVESQSVESKRENSKSYLFQEYDNGTVYKGEFVEGKRHGYGVEDYPNGDNYDGYWKEDVRHGYGTFSKADGSKLEGNWVDGELTCSHGTLTYSNGDVFQGDVVKGMAHGSGILRTKVGGIYDGEFKDNYIEGYGIFIFSDGSSFNGDWKHGDLHGHGFFRFGHSSDYLEGDWKDGKKTGKCEYIFPDLLGRFSAIWEDGNLKEVLNDSTVERSEVEKLWKYEDELRNSLMEHAAATPHHRENQDGKKCTIS
jgi:hypothetical protein